MLSNLGYNLSVDFFLILQNHDMKDFVISIDSWCH
jgi:hypothetical protein